MTRLRFHFRLFFMNAVVEKLMESFYILPRFVGPPGGGPKRGEGGEVGTQDLVLRWGMV